MYCAIPMAPIAKTQHSFETSSIFFHISEIAQYIWIALSAAPTIQHGPNQTRWMNPSTQEVRPIMGCLIWGINAPMHHGYLIIVDLTSVFRH